MKTKMIPISACFLLGTLWAGSAQAAQVLFNLTQTDLDGNFISTTTFQLPQSPIPDFVDTADSYFEIVNVNQVVNGVPSISDYYFYAAANDGGLQIGDDFFSYYFAGPQLFSGTLDQPTFSLGTSYLYPYYTPPYFLTVTVSPVSDVPEPATWAMMLTGFAALGYAGYRRQQKSVFALA